MITTLLSATELNIALATIIGIVVDAIVVVIISPLVIWIKDWLKSKGMNLDKILAKVDEIANKEALDANDYYGLVKYKTRKYRVHMDKLAVEKHIKKRYTRANPEMYIGE